MTQSVATSKRKSPMVAVIAGSIAGGVETTSIWPMEMIKTNMQLGTMKQHYTGMYGGFRFHVQRDGVRSLYRGLAPVLLGSIPKAGIRFGTFDFLKRQFADETGRTTASANLAAGMIAGAIEATLTTTPIETVKTKLIDANVGMVQGFRTIIQTEGIRGVYQGLTATVMKQASNQGLRFMWFTEYKARVPGFLERRGIVQDYSTLSQPQLALVSLVGGMSAGIFSTLGNNRYKDKRIYIRCGIVAFDVLKTKMQGLEATSRYRSTLDCARQTFREEGIRGFYSGVLPRLGRVIPGQGIIFMSYDTISAVVSQYLDR